MTEPGRCVFCGCDELDMVERQEVGAPGSQWANEERTVCTSCEQAPIRAAVELGQAIASVQLGIYGLEIAWGERAIACGLLEADDFSEAYANAARLFASLTVNVNRLLEKFPASRRPIEQAAELVQSKREAKG